MSNNKTLWTKYLRSHFRSANHWCPRRVRRIPIYVSVKDFYKGPLPGKWHVLVLALLYLFECLNEWRQHSDIVKLKKTSGSKNQINIWTLHLDPQRAGFMELASWLSEIVWAFLNTHLSATYLFSIKEPKSSHLWRQDLFHLPTPARIT